MPEEIEKLRESVRRSEENRAKSDKRIDLLENLIFDLIRINIYRFSKSIQIQDGRNIELNTGIGTKIGTATGQKLGFYNVTPVDQPATISDPTGGATVDTEARTGINTLIDRLQELGLIA